MRTLKMWHSNILLVFMFLYMWKIIKLRFFLFCREFHTLSIGKTIFQSMQLHIFDILYSLWHKGIVIYHLGCHVLRISTIPGCASVFSMIAINDSHHTSHWLTLASFNEAMRQWPENVLEIQYFGLCNLQFGKFQQLDTVFFCLFIYYLLFTMVLVRAYLFNHCNMSVSYNIMFLIVDIMHL